MCKHSGRSIWTAQRRGEDTGEREASEEVTSLLGLRGPGEYGMKMTYLAGIQRVRGVRPGQPGHGEERGGNSSFGGRSRIKENTGFFWNEGSHANICKFMQMNLVEWPGRRPSW